MQVWLVTVIIKRMNTREGIYSLTSTECVFLRMYKNTIQTIIKHILPHLLNQFFWLMRHVKRVLDGITFLKTSPSRHGVEISQEISIQRAWANKLRLWIKKIFPVRSHFRKTLIIRFLIQIFCKLCNGVATKRILHGMRSPKYRSLILLGNKIIIAWNIRTITSLHKRSNI